MSRQSFQNGANGFGYNYGGGTMDNVGVYPMVMNEGGGCKECGGMMYEEGGQNFQTSNNKDLIQDKKTAFTDWLKSSSYEKILHSLGEESGHKLLESGFLHPDEDLMKRGGDWISKAVNPAHKGYCTPMTKSTCTPRRKAFAMTMKKHHGFHKAEGGALTHDISIPDLDVNEIIMAYGGTNPESVNPTGAATAPASFKTINEFHQYHQKAGNKLVPGSNQEYYDPKQYTPSSQTDRLSPWTASNNAPLTGGNYPQQTFGFTAPTPEIKQTAAKPFVAANSGRTAIGFGTYGAGSVSYKDNTTGAISHYDKSGQPIQMQGNNAPDVNSLTVKKRGGIHKGRKSGDLFSFCQGMPEEHCLTAALNSSDKNIRAMAIRTKQIHGVKYEGGGPFDGIPPLPAMPGEVHPEMSDFNKMSQDFQSQSFAAGPQTTTTQQKSNPFFDFLNSNSSGLINAGMAGMEGVTSLLNSVDNRKKQAWLNKRTQAENVFAVGQGNRGDYSVNEGYFRPDQMLPVGNRGNTTMSLRKRGGAHKTNEEIYELTADQIQHILKSGGSIEFVD